MTSPPPIVFGPSGPGLAPLIQALQQRNQQALQREQLALQRQVQQANIQNTQANTARLTLETELAQRDAKGREEAGKALQTITENGTGFTQESVAAALARLKTPQAVMHFLGAVPGFGEALGTPADVRTGEAGATSAEVGADVAVATAPDVIQQTQDETEILTRTVDAQVQTAEETATTAAANSRLALAEAEVAEATIPGRIEAVEAENARTLAQTGALEADARLTELRADRDPARVDLATKIWPFVPDWKTARETVGLAAGGIPDDETAPTALTQGSEGNAASRESGSFARQMIPSNFLMDALEAPRARADGTMEEGTRITLGGELFRNASADSFTGATIRTFINSVRDPDEQRLIQASLQYTMAYRFFMSGQQSSDKELARMILLTTAVAEDSDEVITQKAVMRTLQIDSVALMAQGFAPEVLQLIDSTIMEFRARGAQPRFLKFLADERRRFVTRRNLEAQGIAPTLPVGTTPGAFNADSLMNVYTNSGR